MLKIAIVEDEDIHYETLKGHLLKFADESGSDFDISWDNSPLHFIDTYKCQYDILFLDIKMPGITGMQLAKQIREIDPHVVIIFITSLAQYAIEGYTVQAVDYILKPIIFEEFKLKMTRLIKKHFQEMAGKAIICTKNKAKYKISVKDIIYIDTNVHQVNIHTEDDEYSRYCSMGDIEKELKDQGFLKINSCFLVNKKAISGINHDECVLKNGTSLKISRSHLKEIKDAFKAA